MEIAHDKERARGYNSFFLSREVEGENGLREYINILYGLAYLVFPLPSALSISPST